MPLLMLVAEGVTSAVLPKPTGCTDTELGRYSKVQVRGFLLRTLRRCAYQFAHTFMNTKEALGK